MRRESTIPTTPQKKPVCRPVHWGAVVMDARMAKLIGLQMGFWSRDPRELIEENTDKYGKKSRNQPGFAEIPLEHRIHKPSLVGK